MFPLLLFPRCSFVDRACSERGWCGLRPSGFPLGQIGRISCSYRWGCSCRDEFQVAGIRLLGLGNSLELFLFDQRLDFGVWHKGHAAIFSS